MSAAGDSGPEIVTEYAHEVRVLPHVEIPLADGTVLSARVWLPLDATGEPMRVPVVLEAIPYRKDDVTLVDDEVRFSYFAGFGYAGVRLDLRGSGDSEGVLDDEYSPQEQRDLVEVIAWLAAQPWSSGRIGMIGISWSGFNALQVAAHRPDALKAVISVCSSDDRYDNDVHYMGGAVLAFYLSVWGGVMNAFSVRPPDPAIVGEKWESMWRERLEANPLFADRWLRHQRRDDYWRQGSVCEDYAAIEVPVLAVSGWADAYTDTVFRLLENLPGIRKGIVGPWGHTWPERGLPGPAIGFLQECLRWWDRWLKEEPNGVEDDPLLRYWAQDSIEVGARTTERPGRWLQTDALPSADAPASASLYLAAEGALRAAPGEGASLTHRSPTTVGADAGSWLPYGNPTDLPADQRAEDAASLTFDTDPFQAATSVFGAPALELEVASDQPNAFVFVRLCDVSPDGYSSIITRGALNLTHRGGHDSVEPMVPGRHERVRVPLKAIAHTLPAGHRLRVSVSTQYWPWLWPSPVPATIDVRLGEGSVLHVDGIDERSRPLVRPFEAPQIAPAPVLEQLRERTPVLEATHEDGESVSRLSRDLTGRVRFPQGLVLGDRDDIVFRIRDDEPLSARVEFGREMSFSREGWDVGIRSRLVMTSTATDFVLEGELEASIDGGVVHRRVEHRSVPRDGG